jgi:cytochrome b subunit of formate dehydrogenase
LGIFVFLFLQMLSGEEVYFLVSLVRARRGEFFDTTVIALIWTWHSYSDFLRFVTSMVLKLRHRRTAMESANGQPLYTNSKRRHHSIL